MNPSKSPLAEVESLRPRSPLGLQAQLAMPNSMPKHVISLKDFDRDAMEHCFRVARAMENAHQSEYMHLADGRVAAVLWYQQSFRTRLGFEVAIQRLGGRITGFSDPNSSRSVGWYAESLEDVVRFGGSVVDMIFMRHYETGALARAAAASPVPVFSGGSGFGEHPSQALGDIYHLKNTFGSLDGLRMGIVGSLNWRVFRSLSFGLAKYNTKLIFLTPPTERDLPKDVEAELKRTETKYEIVSNIGELLDGCDAVTTLGASQSEFDKAKSEAPKMKPTPASHKITVDALARVGRPIVVMHVGPITDEIDREIDQMPCGHYFAEARAGMWMRMATIATSISNVNRQRDIDQPA